MATQTPNIGLTLPIGTEHLSRSIVNNNNTIIDTKMGAVGNTDLQTQVNNLNTGKVNTSDIANNLTTTTAGKVLDARQGKALSDQIASLVEVQTLDISGFTFDGTMREIRPQITLKSGYKPYVINLIPSHYDLHHYPDYWSDVDSSGKFYVEENLPSNLVSLRAVILWIKDS